MRKLTRTLVSLVLVCSICRAAPAQAGAAENPTAAPQASPPVTTLVYCGGSDSGCVTANIAYYGSRRFLLQVAGHGFRSGKIWVDGRVYWNPGAILLHDMPDKSCSNTTQCSYGSNYFWTSPRSSGKHRLEGCAWRSGVGSTQICTYDFEII